MDRFGEDSDSELEVGLEIDESFEFDSYPPRYEEIPSAAAEDDSMATMVVSEECEGRPRRVKYALARLTPLYTILMVENRSTTL